MSEQTVPRVMENPIRTPRRLVSMNPKKHPWEQAQPLHNRWHPDIPPVSLSHLAWYCKVQSRNCTKL